MKGFVFLILITYSQTCTAVRLLHAGTYHNLKTNEPLVLDTGNFSFIGLKMNGLGSKSWIDGRKATRIRFSNCFFKGNNAGTAILTSNNLTILDSCYFLNLESALVFCVADPNSQNDSIRIFRSTFFNNQTSVYLKSGNINLELRENDFSNLSSLWKETIGLRIGKKATIHNNLGGEGTFFSPLPCGNLWPTLKMQKNTNSKWTSIHFDSLTNQVSYFRFKNELVGSIYPLYSHWFSIIETKWEAKGNLDAKDWCLQFPDSIIYKCKTKTLEQSGWPSNHVVVIQNKEIKWPTITGQFRSGRKETLKADLSEFDSEIGDPIPNHTSGKTYIPVFWTKEKGELVIFESSTGREKERKAIFKGRQMVEFNIQAWPSGVYGYRLEGEGKCPEPKKLIIIH